jgi:ABC-type lipoprotein export system ATPase subunit
MPALSLSNLKFRYEPRGPWIVDVADLELERGEQMLLTAGSGRGKSTLLHLICGLIDPDEGSVRVNGQDIHALHGAERDLFRGRTIGVIFQNFNLLHGFSALENVAAALMFSRIPRGEHRRRALTLLQHLGIDRPHRTAHRLSIGQQQRVAVARAVACHPRVVLADEPTASLDPENAAVAMELIQRTCREQEAALLCVSHDPAMVERFERRACLDALAAAA